jgi:hypothetical protein
VRLHELGRSSTTTFVLPLSLDDSDDSTPSYRWLPWLWSSGFPVTQRCVLVESRCSKKSILGHIFREEVKAHKPLVSSCSCDSCDSCQLGVPGRFIELANGGSCEGTG